MIEISNPKKMQQLAEQLRHDGKKIGLVPTMGAFHEGHLALMRQLRPRVDYLIVSLFVNPIQFGVNEDLSKYPHPYQQDKTLAENVGVDCLFTPNKGIMYPDDYYTYVNVEKLTETLCGAFRLDHFKGVTTVVAKLFNICKPHVAIFGQKDAQQAIIIKRMVDDLNIDIKLELGATYREPDGLAMSSRNVYLTANERIIANKIFKGLKQAKEAFNSGVRDSEKLKSLVLKQITVSQLFIPQYVEIVDLMDLQPLSYIDDKALLAVAVFLGTTRLIDNVILGEPETLW
jgi:pantoate--beta-alanine ligase